MKKILFSGVCCFAIFCGILSSQTNVASAFARLSITEENYIQKNETIDTNIYSFGSYILVEGQANKDIVCAGDKVVISGNVSGDVVCAAKDVIISGNVSGNVRLAAKKVTIEGIVDKNVTIAAAELDIEDTAKVNGELGAVAGDIDIDGYIAGDVTVNADSMSIRGTVGKDVKSDLSSIFVDENAKINGSLSYTAYEATVNGTVVGRIDEDIVNRTKNSSNRISNSPSMSIGFALTSVIWLTALSFILLGVAPRTMKKMANISGEKDILKASLIGLVAVVVFIPLLIVLALTVIGIPVVLLMMLLAPIFIIVSGPVVALYIGQLIKAKGSIFMQGLIGSIIVGLLVAFPWGMGFIMLVLVVIFGTGMILYSMRSEYGGVAKTKKAKK